jgi:hypothetical protein
MEVVLAMDGFTSESSPVWHRAMSRRCFLGTATAVAGAIAAGFRLPAVMADDDELATIFPLPIPGGVSPFGIFIHHFPPVPVLGPGPINEPSQIFDFNGLVGITRVTGSGTGTDTSTGVQTRLNYQVDNGFMSGLYRGEDGLMHHGTFAFI